MATTNMKENIIGVDIGGTKCAVTYGQQEGNRVTILDKELSLIHI